MGESSKPTSPARLPSWKAMGVIVALMPALWAFGYGYSRWCGCDPEMARWRSTAATVAWPLGCLAFLLIRGGFSRARGDLLPIVLVTHTELLGPKREVQRFPEVLREGLTFAIAGGIAFGLFFRAVDLIERKLRKRKAPAEDVEAG